VKSLIVVLIFATFSFLWYDGVVVWENAQRGVNHDCTA
jgi:hypothetical protein